MGVTISGPFGESVPYETTAPIVYVKQAWGDVWEVMPELRFVSGRACVASAGYDEVTLRYEYGRAKEPYDSDFAVRDPLDLMGWWCRVRLAANDEEDVTIFVGKFGPHDRDIGGHDVAMPDDEVDVATGEQVLTAYGPMQILKKIDVATSVWEVETSEAVDEKRSIGWLPQFNDRDGKGWLHGNRTAAVGEDGVYLFGGKYPWTNREIIDYLLYYFADATGGPTWTLTGQVEPLDALEEQHDFGDTSDLARMLLKLIPREKGLDFVVRPSDEGFDLQVFALLGKEFSFGDTTLPCNPNTLKFEGAMELSVDACKIERTADFSFGEIRVVGQRLVVCCSLHGASALPNQYGTTLVGKWDEGVADAYHAGTGDSESTAKEHDEARAADRFAAVYQHFGAPQFWDHNDGDAAPAIDDEGKLIPKPDETEEEPEETPWIADRQLTVRSTLDWLPLKEGFDYSLDPAENNNPAGHEPEFLAPQAWIERETSDATDPDDPAHYYEPVAELGIDVSVPQNDWGVVLNSQPQHLLAATDWPLTAAATENSPERSYQQMCCTIAFYGDTRLQLVWQAEEHQPTDGVLVYEVPDAEYWVLAPHTIVGQDTDGQLLTSGDTPRVLRDDGDRLGLVMAGLLARYYASRAKAEVTLHGWWPWTELLGQILEAVSEKGDMQEIAGPITSIRWNPKATVINTGYSGIVIRMDRPRDYRTQRPPGGLFSLRYRIS